MKVDQIHMAENVAAVSFHFLKMDWPRPNGTSSPYDFFQGFAGFWCFCALAGLAFARQEQCDEEWIETLEHYCGRVFHAACAARRLLTERELEFLSHVSIQSIQFKDMFPDVAFEADFRIVTSGSGR